MLVDQERGLIFSGGVGSFTVTDVNSNLELTRLLIEGRITRMRFGPSKCKLLVQTLTNDGYNFYDFDVRTISRKYHKFNAKL